jgi:lactoylglutathione lyase
MNAPVPLHGLFEAHLTTSDLERSIDFYRDVVGLPLAYELPQRGAAFFWIGKPGEAMLGLWSLGSAPIEISSHIAFRVSLESVIDAFYRLRSVGVTPLSFFATETDEPSVIGWMPAAAVYFRDPDGNLLEYLAMLDATPLPEAGVLPWSQWQNIVATQEPAVPPYTIGWHQGEHAQLRDLFELAEDSSEQLDRYIDLGRVLVALDDCSGEVLGHLQLTPTAEAGVEEIKSLAVRAGFRRRGVGRALVDHAIEACRVEHAAAVTVTTAVADIDNLRFYQRCGFRASSIERDAFTPGSGYQLGLSAFGILLRDAIRFDLSLGRPERQGSSDGHE